MVVAGRLTREGFIAYRRREEFPLLEVVRVPVLVEQPPLPPDRVWIREPRRPVYYRERSAPPQRSTVWRDEPEPMPPATPRTVRVAGGYKVIDDRDDASFDLFYGRKIERADDDEYGSYGWSQRPYDSRRAVDDFGYAPGSLSGARRHRLQDELTASDVWPGTAFGERTRWEEIGCHPKDGWEGLSGRGGAALIAAPVVGAKEHGVKGAAAGVVAGIAGLGIGVVGGVFGGAAMMVKGAVNTPGTVAALATDDDLHGKETIDLSAVTAERVAEEDRYRDSMREVNDYLDEEKSVYKPTKEVKETALYDALGVAPDAGAGAIKRSYYKKAMQHHPDKGGDTQVFQKIGAAYQVLSDDEKRRKYDAGGEAALAASPVADAGVVFAMMFGDAKFEHLCGELSFVLAMRIDEGLPPNEKAAKLAAMQTVREERLAKLLAARLDTWLGGDKEGFVKGALDELETLSKTNLGPQMLVSIGMMYELTADRELGMRGRLGIAGLKADAHGIRTHARALGGGLDLAKIQQQQKESGEGDDDEKAARAKELQAALFNVMALDIESTVGRAAHLVLHDTSVTKEQRRERARGILKLGRIFQGQFTPQ